MSISVMHVRHEVGATYDHDGVLLVEQIPSQPVTLQTNSSARGQSICFPKSIGNVKAEDPLEPSDWSLPERW